MQHLNTCLHGMLRVQITLEKSLHAQSTPCKAHEWPLSILQLVPAPVDAGRTDPHTSYKLWPRQSHGFAVSKCMTRQQQTGQDWLASS